jgi:hypothetical protein
MPGVRQTAVEVLDKMGPVTGDKETRLLATLAALRGRVADPYQVYGLPTLYGRDRRILDYLIELFRRGNRWERALAASELFGLAEIDTALEAARDPEARVRRSLAAAVGWSSDPRELQVLQQLLGDMDSGVATQARASLKRLGVAVATEPRPDEFHWAPFLKELSEFRLSYPRVAAAVPERKAQDRKAGSANRRPANSRSRRSRAGSAGRYRPRTVPFWQRRTASSNRALLSKDSTAPMKPIGSASGTKHGPKPIGRLTPTWRRVCRLAMSEIALLYC